MMMFDIFCLLVVIEAYSYLMVWVLEGSCTATLVDLLNDPNKSENHAHLAANTALWFYKANNMAQPA